MASTRRSLSSPPEVPVGVFDSGIGGLSVLRALREELPGEDFVYLADSGFAPYGERGDEFVTARTLTIARYLHDQHHIKALVVACNTATAAAIHAVRSLYPQLPVIGVEPALKPALAVTQTHTVGVIATRGTVESAKFQALLNSVQGQAHVVVQACDGLAAAIERHALHPDTANATEIRALCGVFIGEIGQFGHQKGQVDTLVLGCTHYVFAIPALRELLGERIALLDNGPAIARQTRRLLTQAEHLAAGRDGQVTLITTGESAALRTAATHWLALPADLRAEAIALPH